MSSLGREVGFHIPDRAKPFELVDRGHEYPPASLQTFVKCGRADSLRLRHRIQVLLCVSGVLLVKVHATMAIPGAECWCGSDNENSSLLEATSNQAQPLLDTAGLDPSVSQHEACPSRRIHGECRQLLNLDAHLGSAPSRLGDLLD